MHWFRSYGKEACRKNGVTVKRSWCHFLTLLITLFMITINKWVGVTSLINFYNTTKQDGKPTSNGRPCFITVLILQQQMLISFTVHPIHVLQQSRHDHRSFISTLVKELLKAGSTVRLMSGPVGNPFRCDAQAQHRFTYILTKHCVLCKSKKKYKRSDKLCIKFDVPLCFTHDRDCFAQCHLPSCDTIRGKYMKNESIIRYVTTIDFSYYIYQTEIFENHKKKWLDTKIVDLKNLIVNKVVIYYLH